VAFHSHEVLAYAILKKFVNNRTEEQGARKDEGEKNAQCSILNMQGRGHGLLKKFGI
jgi:hypothetical protein